METPVLTSLCLATHALCTPGMYSPHCSMVSPSLSLSPRMTTKTHSRRWQAFPPHARQINQPHSICWNKNLLKQTGCLSLLAWAEHLSPFCHHESPYLWLKQMLSGESRGCGEWLWRLDVNIECSVGTMGVATATTATGVQANTSSKTTTTTEGRLG